MRISIRREIRTSKKKKKKKDSFLKKKKYEKLDS